ncbi:hypothetical protein QR98_0081480 [Sarcoptes scabiei]|uniref:Uncharacterized protein n=1 Tax=Sarcoptes scabiei TaxID=52283 RepID=A0A132AFI3_SARSC|nr:hypothetical protein QR98_0081480 [Sarcoptes scabiei]
MDILPSGHFFNELQAIHDTGYFPANLSLEDKYEQKALNGLGKKKNPNLFKSLFHQSTHPPEEH